MYHRPKFLSHIFIYLSLLFISFLLGQRVFASSSDIFIPDAQKNAVLISLMPKEKFYKHKPTQANIYQYDDSPLGKREPLLIVHGLRAEYYPAFRWGKLIKRLNANKEFADKFKIYLARYDTTISLDKTVPQMQEKIAALYHSSGNKPIVVLALSIGGNLIYESMLNPETDKQIKMFISMGTPFHGSPLFSADWLQYGIYKNLAWPWTRIDHSLAYRLYFARNPILLVDYRWDNCDQAIPMVGKFASKLPLGPSGFLAADQAINNRMVSVNKRNFDKSKLITYSGYVLNPYQLPNARRVIESTFLAPYTMFTISLPFHLAREHAVLKMLNRIIATVITTEPAAKKVNNNFVYVLNDGITPIASSMFLADQYSTQKALTHEADLEKLRPFVDVRTARVFRNIDHLTYMDGDKPGVIFKNIRDELNPKDGVRDIFNWILHDLECTSASENLAQNRDT